MSPSLLFHMSSFPSVSCPVPPNSYHHVLSLSLSHLSPQSTCLTFQRSLGSGYFHTTFKGLWLSYTFFNLKCRIWIIYPVPQSIQVPARLSFQLSELGPSTPSTARECCSFPLCIQGGRHTRLWGKGWGTILTKGQTLWYSKYVIPLCPVPSKWSEFLKIRIRTNNYGSGSSHRQAKKLIKTLISRVLWLRRLM